MTFIATKHEDMQKRGWNELDVIFVSGDAYIDHPAFGIPLLARWLSTEANAEVEHSYPFCRVSPDVCPMYRF